MFRLFLLAVLAALSALLPTSQAMAQSKVIGNIDNVVPSGSDYRVYGWACSTGISDPINVHLYAGGAAGTGTFVKVATANRASEAAVATACQSTGTAHRFSIVLTAADRQQHANRTIYIHGISPVGAGNLVINRSGVFVIPAPVTLTRRYVYDQHQQLCKITEPETGATLLGYDAAGNVAWSASGLPEATACDATGTTTAVLERKAARSYDARNRIATMAFPDGLGNTTRTYTADGKLASITADNGAAGQIITQYTYNRLGMMTGETMTGGNPLGYVYDANRNLASESSGGFNVTYAPNALGQPTQAGTYANGVSYFPNGAIRQFTYGNGIVHTLTQNARQFPDTSVDTYGTTAVLNDGYDYDFNGNVAAISDGLNAARGNRTMTYDGLDRLTATTSPMFGTGGAAYSYDAIDNLKRVQVPGRDHTYVYDANQRLTNVIETATSATVTGLGYDVQGNLSNKNGRAFAFDYGNRLRSVSDGGGTYVYDGHGRRVRDTTNASKYSQYSATGKLMYTSDGRVKINSKYVYLGGSLVAIRERHGDLASGYQFIDKYQHTDALGSPVAVTDASRQVIERSEYEPYGKRLASSTPAVKDGVGYTGHVEDAATGLTYMQQRYYDPGIGRFLSVDPVTAYDTGDYRYFNRYAYAFDNPYKFTDPDGRCPNCVTGGIGAVAGLVVGLGMEGFRQFKSGDFNGRAFAVEGGKGALVGGLIGLTGGAAAASGMSLSAQALTTGGVGLGVGAGAHSVGEVAKGNSAPSAGESLAVGAATAAGAIAGAAMSPVTSRLTTTVTPAVASHPVTSLSGKTFNTVNVPAQTVTRPAAAEVLNSTAGSIVEEKVKPN
ncbi:MAG: hypothetical protein M3Q42_11655 [Pseudomonadota bacterium]|nr:hypothetical protein [Pseudomonadota bacterium]